MRQPAEKVKEGVLHAELEVRDAAASYFAESFSDDPTVMPLVIQAIEKYGFDAAFTGYSFWTDLVQTDETVAWLSRQLQKLGQPDSEDEVEPVLAYNAAVTHADPDVLNDQQAQIMALESLDPDSRADIAERIEYRSRTADELWADLVEFCEERDNDESIADEDFEFGCRLVEALGRFRDQLEARVLDIIGGYTNELGTWLEGFAIRLAGEMKLEAAIPLMLATLQEGTEDWISDECHRAFTKIGTQAVVVEFTRHYAVSEWLERMAIAGTLANIHSDESVQACFDFLKSEEDEEICGALLKSILVNFCPEGVEPARQFILAMPLSPDVLELRIALLTACKLLGTRVPEFDAWLEDSKNDRQLRQKWYDEHPASEDDEDFEDEDIEDEDFEDEDFEDEDAEEHRYEPPMGLTAPIVRKSERVGRNDPCPCGSGKKYKKCCYDKDSVEEADSFHSSAMGEIASGERRTKFPIGTLALYGPDDKITTKIVGGVIKREGAEPILERWVGTNIKQNPKVQRQIQEFFQKHGVKSAVALDANIGCPHEEGPDFPLGEDCPFCPFWKGKQGSNQKE